MAKETLVIKLPEGVTLAEATPLIALSLGYRDKVQTKTDKGFAMVVNPVSAEEHVTQALEKLVLDHYSRGYKSKAAIKAADEAQKELDEKLGLKKD